MGSKPTNQANSHRWGFNWKLYIDQLSRNADNL